MPKYNGFDYNQDVNNKAGAAYPFLGGNGFVVPEFDGSSVALPLTVSPLTASGTFIGPTRDRLNLTAGAVSAANTVPGVLISKIKGIAYADQSGTMYIEESNDSTTWTQTATITVSSNVLTDSGWFYLSKRYYRLRYVNGSTVQTVFGLYSCTGSGQADANVTLTGSNTAIPVDLQYIDLASGVQLPVSSAGIQGFQLVGSGSLSVTTAYTETAQIAQPTLTYIPSKYLLVVEHTVGASTLANVNIFTWLSNALNGHKKVTVAYQLTPLAASSDDLSIIALPDETYANLLFGGAGFSLGFNLAGAATGNVNWQLYGY